MDFEIKYANDSLPSLERKLAAAVDNLTAAENKTQSLQVTIGHILLAAAKMFKYGAENNGGATGFNAVGITIKDQTFRQWCDEHSGRSWHTCVDYMGRARSPSRFERAKKCTAEYRQKREKVGAEVLKVFKPTGYDDPAAQKERRIQFAVRALVHLLPDEYTEALRRAEHERNQTGFAQAAE